MEERDKLCIGYMDRQYVVVDMQGSVVAVLAPGAVFEVWMDGHWQVVRLQSGGYRGCYYVTPQGARGRFALCMGVRLCQVPAQVSHDVGVSPVEQIRLTWVGKRVQNKIPLATGSVCGEVLEVTKRGMVLFGYTSPVGSVPVRATFPVERIDEVLAVVS